MNTEQNMLFDSTETGSLGVMHLKRYWNKNRLKKEGKLSHDALLNEWNIDVRLLSILGLGLEQTIQYLYTSDHDFITFENWIIAVNEGQLSQTKIQEFNAYITNRQTVYKKDEAVLNVLSDDDLNHWNERGYVIVREAISIQDCEKTIDVICEFINVNKHDANTWYQPHAARQGIMVQMFQHAVLEKNRLSPKIRLAYEQLWQRKDLWVNTDRVGFNPPERNDWKFPGPGLHFDVSLELPFPFGLQGILYLSETTANPGAFTVVPCFHHKIETWLTSLSSTANPRTENLYALGTEPIAAHAGDFIIWHQALPHGSSPNTADQPRYVQYINYAPLDAEVNPVWK